MVADGRFRQDLYYRINVVKIDLPPLRERVSDIPLLAEHFLAQHAAQMGKPIVGFSPEALDILRRYAWPGNVRELSNVIERAAVLTRTPTIKLEDLPVNVIENRAAWTPTPSAAAHVGPATLGRIGPDNAADPFAPPPAQGGTTGQAPSLVDAMRAPERRIIIDALRAAGWNRAKAADNLHINRTTLYKKMKALGIDPRREALAG
jgi:DNA-binding NtrC family response regulator